MISSGVRPNTCRAAIAQAVVGAHRACAKGVHLHHDRLRHADGVGKRDLASSPRAGAATMFFAMYRAIYAPLRSTLVASFTAERSAAVRDKRPVAVYHEFSAREARIRVRAAQHKTPGWVDKDTGIFIGGQCPQGGNEDLCPERLCQASAGSDIVPGAGRTTTTVSSRTGCPSPYSTVTWAFPSGSRPSDFSRLTHIGKPHG